MLNIPLNRHNKWGNKLLRALALWLGLCGMMFASSVYAQTQEPPKPIIDWQKRQTADQRLTAFGDDLMGDSIEPHIGSLVFAHTDVSLPGNSSLDVSIRRRLVQGYKYDEGVNVEFGDWELDVPKITAVAIAAKGWAGKRCNDNWGTNFPPLRVTHFNGNGNISTSYYGARDYSNGVSVSVPGQGSQQVLKVGAGSIYPGKASTTKQWHFTCTTASDGKEGFIGRAPNGHVYSFKKAIIRAHKELGFIKSNRKVARIKVILAATEVKDVHGNWVRYTYDSAGRMTQIKANDGREITLGYSGTLITSVTANSRTWNYTYRQSAHQKRDWDANGYGTLNSQVLSRVTQPDGQSWIFGLDGMQAEPRPSTTRGYDQQLNVSITHPYGTVGVFELKDIRHRQAYRYYQNVPEGSPIDLYGPEPAPPSLGGGGPPPPPIAIIGTRAMAVQSKTLSIQGSPDAVWTFNYEQDRSCLGISYPNICATGSAFDNTGGSTGGSTGSGNTSDPDGPSCGGPNCENYFWFPGDDIWGDWKQHGSIKTRSGTSVDAYTKVASLSHRKALPPAVAQALGIEDQNNFASQMFGDFSDIPKPKKIEDAPVLMAQLSPSTITQGTPSDDYWATHSPPYYSDDMYTSSGHNPINFTNWTKVRRPNGSLITYYHLWTWEQSFGGNLVKQTTSGGGASSVTEYTYAQEVCNGGTVVSSGPASKPGRCSTHTTKTVTRQDGDTFTTENSYDMEPNSGSYSYGNPVQTKVFSNVSTAPRITNTAYEHKTNKWILGLPKTVTTNGRNMATYDYNANGQKTTETRNGAPYATYSYNSDGTMQWAKDAINRRTTALNWKRGTPQEIKRADTVSTYQYVDDNGWLTSSIDANGNTTSYSRDDMGRLETYTPPTGWTPTTIDYDFSGPITQTIAKGDAETIITYDAMFRPTLVQTKDSKTNGDGSSYLKTTYNAAGQAVFTSFPSTIANPTKGTTTTYDGLGRVTGTLENTIQQVSTSTEYLSGHRVRTTDPLGFQTTIYTDGYGGPGKGDVLLIEQPEDVSTQIFRNTWGQIDKVRQSGFGDDGAYKMEDHHYYYDTQYRLCRHFTQSGRGVVYQYNAAGEVTAYNKGKGAGYMCDTPAGASLVNLSYDAIGRVTLTDYADTGTPDIARTYDNNGNVKTVHRGSGADAVDWDYTYDTMNNLTTELLSVDTEVFPMSYVYDADGYMTQRTLPSGRLLSLENDGLGRLDKVFESGQIYAQNIAYHASGAISGMAYGNGQIFSQSLTDRLQPKHMLSSKGGNKALDLLYTYDKRGKVSTIDNAAILNNTDDRTYQYDALGRLSAATGSWGSSSYKYDALGNILEKQVGTRTIKMTYNAINRISSHVDIDITDDNKPIAGTTRTLNYDPHGNVSWLGAQRFRYDKSDQPHKLLGTVEGDYVYDGNLKRVKSVIDINGTDTTIYNVYDASGTLVHVYEETDGRKTDYIGKIARVKRTGPTTAPIDTPTWLHMDHLGSAQTGTSLNGLVAWREQYTPYGITLTNPLSNKDQAGFTGHIKDSATGLNYMQARYYDPVIGRFLSIDPMTMMDADMNPGMFNRYAYSFNDPINHTDPDGEFAMFITAAVGAAVGGVVGGGIEAYKQHKAGNGFDLGKIGSRAGKGALVGGAVGLTGGAAAGVVGLTGATGAGAAATIGLPSAAVGATGSAIVGITNDIEDGASAETIGKNAGINMATGALGAGLGGAASPAIGNTLTKIPAFGGVGKLNGVGVVVGETAGAIAGSAITEGANAIPLPEPEIEERR